jgi:hypothetical protein
VIAVLVFSLIKKPQNKMAHYRPVLHITISHITD